MKIAAAAFSLLLTCSCASMVESYKAQVCSDEGGYQQGMNDARQGKPMNGGFAQLCDPPVQAVALKSYRQGYTDGIAAGKDNGPQGVVINIGGGGMTTVNPRAFFCEVKAFASTFSDFGPTELEAGSRAKSQCAARYNEMHCSYPACRRNQ